MAQSYTLHEIPNGPSSDGNDVPPSPCIYCGETIHHVNDGGRGWIGGTLLASGEPLLFMYHAHGCDAAERAPMHERIWHCRCGGGPEGNTRDNVGPRCHNCGGPRPGMGPRRPTARDGTTDNSYYAMVWLERDLGDDFYAEVIEPEPDDTPAQAATRQIARELQTTCNDLGLPAGFFQVQAVLLADHEPALRKEMAKRVAARPHVWTLVWQSEDGTLLHHEAFATREAAYRWAANALLPLRGKAFSEDVDEREVLEIEQLVLDHGPEAAVTRYAEKVGDKVSVKQKMVRDSEEQ